MGSFVCVLGLVLVLAATASATSANTAKPFIPALRLPTSTSNNNNNNQRGIPSLNLNKLALGSHRAPSPTPSASLVPTPSFKRDLNERATITRVDVRPILDRLATKYAEPLATQQLQLTAVTTPFFEHLAGTCVGKTVRECEEQCGAVYNQGQEKYLDRHGGAPEDASASNRVSYNLPPHVGSTAVAERLNTDTATTLYKFSLRVKKDGTDHTAVNGQSPNGEMLVIYTTLTTPVEILKHYDPLLEGLVAPANMPGQLTSKEHPLGSTAVGKKSWMEALCYKYLLDGLIVSEDYSNGANHGRRATGSSSSSSLSSASSFDYDSYDSEPEDNRGRTATSTRRTPTQQRGARRAGPST